MEYLWLRKEEEHCLRKIVKRAIMKQSKGNMGRDGYWRRRRMQAMRYGDW